MIGSNTVVLAVSDITWNIGPQMKNESQCRYSGVAIIVSCGPWDGKKQIENNDKKQQQPNCYY